MYAPALLTLSRPSRQRGFTLVELGVTLVVVAVLSTLAIPSFNDTLRQWRRDSATRSLTASIQAARSEAIKASRPVVVCPTTTGTSCANNTVWGAGWVAFIDDGAASPTTNANNQTIDSGERILQVTQAPAGLATLTNSNNVTSLVFMPNGMLRLGVTTFVVTPEGSTPQTEVSKISVDRMGRASVKTELP